MEKIFKHYSHILDELIDNYNFFSYYFQEPYSVYEDILEEYESGTFKDWSLDIHFGASRGCLVDKTYDYVVKFDFPAEIERASCDAEMGIYSAAARMNLEKYFAKPIFLGTYTKKIYFYSAEDINYNMNIDGYDEEKFSDDLQNAVDNWDLEREEIIIEVPLFAYPRAERYDFGHHSNEEVSSFRATHSDVSPLLERSTSVGIAFVKEYGEEAFEKLSEFLLDHKVNDLHSGNIMSYQNHLILTDYCGFHDSYY